MHLNLMRWLMWNNGFLVRTFQDSYKKINLANHAAHCKISPTKNITYKNFKILHEMLTYSFKKDKTPANHRYISHPELF